MDLKGCQTAENFDKGVDSKDEEDDDDFDEDEDEDEENEGQAKQKDKQPKLKRSGLSQFVCSM